MYQSLITKLVLITSARWLIPDTVLTCSSLKPVGLAATTLFVLPQAAGVEGGHVLEPVGQARDLGGLIPGKDSQVMGSHWFSTPLVV